MRLRLSLLLLGLLFAGSVSAGNPAPFDLAGPTLDVVVTRGGTILPASEVPNLAEGDRIWIKPELPPSQSANYLMVAAFLTGSTNPPPENWFFRCETWTGKCSREGLTVTVPKGAQQVIVFMAPQTMGDYKAIVSAVRGRPGAFVRASQDLNQASLDRSRLDKYLTAIRVLNQGDPAVLKNVAPLLARSLSIKIDDKCMERVPELQASCLMQGQESLILNDGQSVSLAQTLTGAAAADLIMQASVTEQFGYGIYSPYVASVLDIVRILDSFGTAQYQYIPALATQRGDKLALTLNAAPSFYDPKSVLVIALPSVQKPQFPPLRAVDPTEIYCASRTDLVLPVEGAPLVYSTGYSHDMTLSLTGADGKTVNLPAKPDPVQGGYVVSTASLPASSMGPRLKASLQGYWGFEPYKGPSFELRNAQANAWALASGDEDALVVGRFDTVHLKTDSVTCVDNIMLQDAAGKELKAEWKSTKPGEVEVKLPLQDAQPGGMTLLVGQYGVKQPQSIPIKVFSDAGHLDSFSMHAGDTQGVLKGSRLDQVARLSIGSTVFVPGQLSTKSGGDELPMTAQDASGLGAFKPGSGLSGSVTLTDGRTSKVPVTVDEPRPKVTLIGKSVQASRSSGDSNIKLADADELPQDAKLTFSVRAASPAAFTRDQGIEVATADESFSAALTIANGAIRLEDSKVAVVTLDPGKVFGFSAFGPLKFRSVVGGVNGDWQPLATLVRLPVLKDLKCPSESDVACKLSGSDLFLLDSISADPQFSQGVRVADGFPGSTLAVPNAGGGKLYVKLRDDPSVINAVLLEPQLQPLSPEDAARAAAARQQEAAPAKPAAPAPAASNGAPNDAAASPASVAQ